MSSVLRFRVNNPQIIHETFDDQIVLINFDSGNYYSLDKVGADIWGFIESGATGNEIAAGITDRYAGDCVEIENAVNQFLSELRQEDLIVADGTKLESPNGHHPRVEPGVETERLSFEAPVLSKFDDMQGLLLLDPIHEVDQTGWPHAKPDVEDE